MFSLKAMYKEYVEERKLLACIPTYYLNQDPLEIFFGKCRSLNGYNDNPSCQQFQSAYRKLLVKDSVCTSIHANCYNFDMASKPFSNISFVSSRRVKINSNSTDEDEPLPEELDVIHAKLADIEALEKCSLVDTGLYELTITHIANEIQTRISRPDRMYCEFCKNVFV